MKVDDRPRWKHRCPKCDRMIFHEKVYCNPCIKEEPSRGGFRISNGNSSYRKVLLTGIRPTKNHLFALINQLLICVECGHKMRMNDLKHRCYSVNDRAVRVRRQLKCWVCHNRKSKVTFPVIQRGSRVIRIRVCSECLHNAQMVSTKGVSKWQPRP